MKPQQIHPRTRITSMLETLEDLSSDATTIHQCTSIIAEAVEELRDPPTLPEIAALSSKRAWWWEGFIVSTIICTAVVGLILLFISKFQ